MEIDELTKHHYHLTFFSAAPSFGLFGFRVIFHRSVIPGFRIALIAATVAII